MNRFEVDGRPTMGEMLRGVSGSFIPNGGANQALAAQATWFIDPINGSNTNNGKTLGTALKTRSELARRINGIQLTQDVTVNITSSLLAGDVLIPWVRSWDGGFWTLKYVGTPILLFTGVITAYTARNGAASQPTLMTIAGLPVSWTASGLVNHLVEWTDGAGNFIRSVVVNDQGAKQAWLSPPLNQAGVETPFTNGQTVSIYDYPSLTVTYETVQGGSVSYKYLKAPNWFLIEGNCQWEETSGPARAYGSHGVWTNHYSNGTLFADAGSTFSVAGGKNRLIATGGGIRFNVASTTYGDSAASVSSDNASGMQAENGGIIESVVNVNVDVEYLGGWQSIKAISATGGRVYIAGFHYGTIAMGTNVINLLAQGAYVQLGHIPSFGAITGISTSDGTLVSVAVLATQEVLDTLNNRVIGPNGPYLDWYSMMLNARKVIAETVPVNTLNSTMQLIGGTVYYMAVALPKGKTITNLTTVVNVIGTVMTVSRVGIYDVVGNLVASSVDQGASWQTLGQKTIALSTPYLVPSTGIYYFAIIGVGTVLPTFPRAWAGVIAQADQVGAAIGTGVRVFSSQIGQVNLPNPGTPQLSGTAPGSIWIAAS